MSTEKAKSTDVVTSSLVAGTRSGENAMASGCFTIQCYDKDGKLKWESSNHNLVVNQGLQDMNAKYFLGSSYTATWYIGLYGAAASNTPAPGDTAASHAGWTEVAPYSNATRPACTFGTATTADPSVISNSASPASFTINAAAIIGGAFLISDNTKFGTTGTLFSAANFSAPGDRTVLDGDLLGVTYIYSLSAT